MNDPRSTAPDASDTSGPSLSGMPVPGTPAEERLGDLIGVSPMRRLVALRWLLVAIALMLLWPWWSTRFRHGMRWPPS